MNESIKFNYVEFVLLNLVVFKMFFMFVFGWCFIDYGCDYSVFSNVGLDGGIFVVE